MKYNFHFIDKKSVTYKYKNNMFDWKSLIKYVLEGMAVAVATWLIPSKHLEYQEVIIIALTAAAVFAVLDQFSPVVAAGTRHGSGFAIGYNQIGLGDPDVESNQFGGCGSCQTGGCGEQEGGCDGQEGGCDGQEGGCDGQEGGCDGQEGGDFEQQEEVNDEVITENGGGAVEEQQVEGVSESPVESEVDTDGIPQGFDGFHTTA
jgi:hypothetical protein